MTFLSKDLIRNTVAESIYNDLTSRRSNYYYFIGKILPWSNPQQPDTPANTQAYEYETRNSIISVKKIQSTDVSFVVPRINWSSGTVYDEYNPNYSPTNLSSTGAQSLKGARFYVLNYNFNVYKCIFNNNGAPSTVEPTGTAATTFTTVDGYVWKYLYTIPLSQRNRFLTTRYMPVQKAVSDIFYSRGEISSLTIDNRGSGYTGNAEVELVVNGEFLGGTGNSIANLVPVLNSIGQIVDVIIRDAGNNYASANISIIDNAGTGTGYYNTLSVANLVPVLYNTKVDSVVINDPGIGYDANIQTKLVLTGDGTGAKLTPFINKLGELEDVIIESRGSGYTYLDIEVVGDGTGANVFPNLSTGDIDSNQGTVELSAVAGAIHNIKVNAVGNGYTTANIVVTGDGSGFAGTVVLSNTNTISKITVTNPGSGYTYATATIVGNGANANVEPIFAPFDGHGKDPVKELFAETLMFYSTINNERIHGVDVNNDYRQFGIIKDPYRYNNTASFANVIGTTCWLCNVDRTTSILGDEFPADTVLQLVGDATRKFAIVEIVSANSQMLLTNFNNYSITTDTEFYEPNTATTITVNSVDAVPTINKFSGDMLFIDNRTKVSYSDQQLVTLRTVIKI